MEVWHLISFQTDCLIKSVGNLAFLQPWKEKLLEVSPKLFIQSVQIIKRPIGQSHCYSCSAVEKLGGKVRYYLITALSVVKVKF